MKKSLFCLVLIGFLAFLLAPGAVLAGNGNGNGVGEADLTVDRLFDILGDVVGWVLLFVIIVGAIIIIWAGFNFITASGDAEKAKKARNMLTYALLGIAIALAVRGLLQLVASIIDVDLPLLPF